MTGEQLTLTGEPADIEYVTCEMYGHDVPAEYEVQTLSYDGTGWYPDEKLACHDCAYDVATLEEETSIDDCDRIRPLTRNERINSDRDER